jgi:pilus assembly protein Flp/PilA
MGQVLRDFVVDERGATAIEYALIGGLIALVIITGLTNIGTSLNTKFASLATSLR